MPRARPHTDAPKELIFNIIFEFCVVFSCYLTYNMPSAGRTPDRLMGTLGGGVIGGVLYEAESIFNVIFEIYAVFTCYLTYYKPSAKKS